jgi:hypothetical protein
VSDVGDERRGFGRGFEQVAVRLVTDAPPWTAWFGPAEPRPAPRPRYPVLRGGEQRPRSRRAVVTAALFEDAYAGMGKVAELEVRLLSEGRRPGDPRLQLELRPTDDADDEAADWTGPAMGRLIADGVAFDFDTCQVSRLDQKHGALVLEAHLGPDWIDRDETHEELLAVLTGLLVVRTPSGDGGWLACS